MRILTRVLLAVFVVSVVTSPASHARQVTPPAVYFDSGQPVGAAGKIQGTGTYALGNPPHAFSYITLFARPSGGGTLYSSGCSSSSGSWSGVIAGLPAGSYDCWAVMRTTSGGNPVDTSSAMAVVTVS